MTDPYTWKALLVLALAAVAAVWLGCEVSGKAPPPAEEGVPDCPRVANVGLSVVRRCDLEDVTCYVTGAGGISCIAFGVEP